jgi:hypothetical protein
MVNFYLQKYLTFKYIGIVLIMIFFQFYLVFTLLDIPRGSDQFWYVVDAESASSGVYTTNNIFPNSMTNENNDLRPFVQNRPIVFIAGYFINMGFNSLEAYKLINVISYLIILSLLFISLQYFGFSIQKSLSAIAMYIASPLIIFSVYNPLTNLFDASLFSIFILSLFVFSKQKMSFTKFVYNIVLLSVFYFLLITERQDFIIYIWSATLVFTFSGIRHKSISYWQTGILYLTLISTQLLIDFNDFFPKHLGAETPKYATLLTGVNPYFHNMVAYFAKNSDFSELSILEIIKSKISFILNSFKGPFNILSSIHLLLFFIPFYSKRKDLSKLMDFELTFGVLCVLNIIVLFGFQFQYRYSIILIAPSIYIIYNLIDENSLFKFNKVLIPLFFILFLIVNYFALNKFTKEVEENNNLQELVNKLNISHESKAAVIYDGGSSLIWSWLLKKNKEVHYFLPNEMGKLQRDKYNILIYPLSDMKKYEKSLKNDKLFIVGNYYVKYN